MTNTEKKNVAVGKALVAQESEIAQFEKALANANEKLRMALAWKVKLSTHLVVLENGKTRKYISVDSGLPRDVKGILIEAKDHNISLKLLSNDSRYEETPKKVLTDYETSYNNRMEQWSKVCGREATQRINIVLSDCKGFDELWSLVKLLERNAEIAKVKQFEEFFK